VSEAQKFLNVPEDEQNLQESQQMKFNFLEHFKNLGNSILSMFRQKDEDEKDDDGEGNIQIYESNSTSLNQVAPTENAP